MSRLRDMMLVMVLAGAQEFAAAQNPTAQADDSRPTPAPALSGIMGMDSAIAEEDTSSQLPQIPALLGGPRTTLAFTSEMERSNYLRGGINVGGTYDDNSLLTPTNELTNTSYSIFPNISLEQTRSRMRWTLGYAAGLTVNQRFSSRNQGSHDLNFESQIRLSPHVSLRLAEGFLLTSGFFDSGVGTAGSGNGGPNANLITPLAKQRSSATTVEINYHFALNDLVGASGSFYDLHYSDTQEQASLVDSRTASGAAFYFHRMFGQDWAGVSYRFDRITFDPNGETLVHSFMVVNSLTLPKRFTISGYVGPEYADNRGLIPGADSSSSFSEWSVAGGVEAGWQKERTSAALGYSRRISDGRGVLGVVRLQGVHGELRQELFPGWAVGVHASHGINDSLTVPFAGAARKITATSAGVSLERNIGRSLGLRFAYDHDFQDQAGADPQYQGTANRNRFVVTLGYQWSRALGR